VTEAEIVIDNDVILDGEGNLTIDANQAHRVFLVVTNITAELRGATVTGGRTSWPQAGGGIWNSGTLTLTNSMVSQNEAQGGGGIWNSGTLTLTNSTVSGNTAGLRGTLSYGGGILNEGTLTLTNTTVSENTSGGGGGIQIFSGTVTLTNSKVSGNTAIGGGGIGNGGTLTLTNSTVSGNTAESGGGMVIGGTATLTNSTVSGNTAESEDGGGIVNFGTLTLTNSTVSGNTQPTGGGSIYNRFGGTLTLTNTLVDGDCATHEQAVVTSNGYNIESPGNSCGFDTNKGDQVYVTAERLNLGELADNGGPTWTHALLPGSVAIDVIPADMCEVDEDQRGFPRDSMCDVGAFEVQP
jgi:hypothetical protein